MPLRAQAGAADPRHALRRRGLAPAFFVGGFLFDVFLVGRVDAWHMIVQQFAYLAIVSAGLLQMLAEPRETPRSARYVAVRSAVLHFLLGTLLNIYVIFYFKSSSFLASFGFLAVLAALLLANEWRRFGGVALKFALLALCWLSFAALTRLSHERPAWRIGHHGDPWFRAQPGDRVHVAATPASATTASRPTGSPGRGACRSRPPTRARSGASTSR